MKIKIAQGLLCPVEEIKVEVYFDGLIKRVGVINDYSAARNEIIDEAEKQKYDWMVFLDSDEELRPQSVKLIKKYIKSGASDCYTLPRIEFVKDREHYDDSYYPDWQTRIFRLNNGLRYRDKIHESLRRGDNLPTTVRLLRCPIYHYGKCVPAEKIALKYLNYARIDSGLPLLTELPKDYQIDPSVYWGKYIPFIE